MQEATSSTLTAVVQRRVKPGSEPAFESLMRDFIAHVLGEPGHLGINVFRHPDDPGTYTIVDRFATENDRHRFTASSAYKDWMRRLRQVSVSDPGIEEIPGLEFWFTLPQSAAAAHPPRRKMAVLTLLGVYPLTMVLPVIVHPVVATWPSWARGLLIAAAIVALLTWVVMPGIARLFKPWLVPKPSKKRL